MGKDDHHTILFPHLQEHLKSAIRSAAQHPRSSNIQGIRGLAPTNTTHHAGDARFAHAELRGDLWPTRELPRDRGQESTNTWSVGWRFLHFVSVTREYILQA